MIISLAYPNDISKFVSMRNDCTHLFEYICHSHFVQASKIIDPFWAPSGKCILALRCILGIRNDFDLEDCSFVG
jgi:hypothetical protein